MSHSVIIENLQKLRPNSTFLCLSDYKSTRDEIADYNIVFHVSYESLLKRSLEKLTQYKPETDIEVQAKKELMESYSSSLKKLEGSDIDEISDGYRHFYDDAGKIIKGVKLHEESNTLHIYGVVVNKRVKQPSPNVKKVANSKALTLAKDKISKSLPVSKWRQFKIDPTRVGKISVENMNVLEKDVA